jgi:tRNA(fMet)-specific endonuclease VapC
MLRFMLDTDTCIYIIKKQPEHVLRRYQTEYDDECCISTITLSELEFGVEKSLHKERNRLALDVFMVPLEVMPYDAYAAQQYGIVRSYLTSRGQPIGPLDLLIAAHARSLGVSLITNNIREFRKVPGLKVATWA